MTYTCMAPKVSHGSHSGDSLAFREGHRQGCPSSIENALCCSCLRVSSLGDPFAETAIHQHAASRRTKLAPGHPSGLAGTVYRLARPPSPSRGSHGRLRTTIWCAGLHICHCMSILRGLRPCMGSRFQCTPGDGLLDVRPALIRSQGRAPVTDRT